MAKQPQGTPDSGKIAKILQFLKDYWWVILLLLVLGFFALRFFGFL
jgi:hypothetical protein